MRGPATTRPIDSSHVEIDVIRNCNIWIILCYVVFCPVIRTALSTFFSGPQTENHGSATLELSEDARSLENHRSSSGIVVGSDTGPVGS